MMVWAQRVSDTQSPEMAVKYLKEAQRLAMKSLAGQPEFVGSDGLRIGIDQKGMPKILPLSLRREMRKEDIPALRLAMVILELFRVLDSKRVIKISTIIKGLHKAETQIVEDLNSEAFTMAEATVEPWDDFVQTRFPQLLKEAGAVWAKPKWTGFHGTNKSGPNGPAMFTAHIDAIALVRDVILYRKWKALAQSVGAEALIGQIERLGRVTSDLPDLRLGVLKLKPEPAGKMRVFAIPDYWTQDVLKPIHAKLFDLLRPLPTDATFNQFDAVRTVADKVSDGPVWSFDLSAATDRFPVFIQENILSAITGQRLMWKLWRQVLTDRPYWLDDVDVSFDTPLLVTGQPVPIYYGAGQPMGAYSSWAAFAVAHHAIVQYAAWLEGFLGWYKDYMILGDDIVLYGRTDLNARVAARYQRLMDVLGVTIHPGKGLISNEGVFEFAKRLMYRGTLLTLFHWKEWTAGFESIGCFVALIKSLLERGATISLWDAMAAWLGHEHLARLFTKQYIYQWSRPARDLLTLLTSPVGPFPLSVSSWEVLYQALPDRVESWVGVDTHYIDCNETLKVREILVQLLQELREAAFADMNLIEREWSSGYIPRSLLASLGVNLVEWWNAGHEPKAIPIGDYLDYLRKENALTMWDLTVQGTAYQYWTFHPFYQFIAEARPKLFEEIALVRYGPTVKNGKAVGREIPEGEDLPDSVIQRLSPSRWMINGVISGTPKPGGYESCIRIADSLEAVGRHLEAAEYRNKALAQEALVRKWTPTKDPLDDLIEWTRCPLEDLFKNPCNDVIPSTMPERLTRLRIDREVSAGLVLNLHKALRKARKPSDKMSFVGLDLTTVK